MTLCVIAYTTHDVALHKVSILLTLSLSKNLIIPFIKYYIVKEQFACFIIGSTGHGGAKFFVCLRACAV